MSKCEKIYCCELDEYLIPKSWTIWKKQKTAEEQFILAKAQFEPINFLADYCRCRIYLINLFKVSLIFLKHYDPSLDVATPP